MKNYLLIFIVLTACKPSSGPKDAGIIKDSPILDVMVDTSIPVDVGIPDAPVLNALDLTIDATGEPGSNCSPEGANIETMSVKLIPNTTNICTSAHVVHKRLGTVLEEYDTVCPEPQQKLCFENTDSLIMPLTFGGYHVIITGIVNGKSCWIGDASVGIGSEGNTAQSLDLLHQSDCQ